MCWTQFTTFHTIRTNAMANKFNYLQSSTQIINNVITTLNTLYKSVIAHTLNSKLSEEKVILRELGCISE